MSEYKFSCPYCSQHLAGTAAWAGRVLNCPSCQKEFSVPPPPAAAAPAASAAPVLPPPLPAATTPPPLPPGGLRIKGGGMPPATTAAAPEMSPATNEVEERVLAGGRYVIFQYCISILVMSFRRSSDIVYVPPGKDGGSAAIGNSVISLFVGWWGIPWGPIWTISTILKNARGGTDVTQEVLASQVGAMRAANIMARRRVMPVTTGVGMKLFRVGAAIVGLWVLFTLGMIIWGVTKGVQEGMGETKAPPASVSQVGGFQGADHNISINRGTVAFGNSPQAVAVAQDFSVNMRRMREALFEKGSSSSFSATKHEFLTHCELRDDRCAIIVHVPELRNFNAEAQEAMGELAWVTAQDTLKELGAAKPGTKLAVGLRGAMLYNRVLIGTVTSDPKGRTPGLAQTITTSSPEKALYSFFP